MEPERRFWCREVNKTKGLRLVADIKILAAPIKILADKSEPALQALFNVLYALVAIDMKGQKNQSPINPKEVRESIKENLPQALEFLKKYKLPVGPFETVMKNAANKEFKKKSNFDALPLGKVWGEYYEAVHDKAGAIRKDLKVFDWQQKILRALVHWLTDAHAPSERLLQNPKNKYRAEIDPRVLTHMKKKVSRQTDTLKKLKGVVKRLVQLSGDPDAQKRYINATRINSLDAQQWQLKEKGGKLYQEYLELRKPINESSQSELEDFILSKGGKPQPLSEVKKHFQANGFEDSFPNNLDVLVDGDKNMYNKKGVRLESKIPDPSYPIKMNPNYDPDKDDSYVYQIKMPSGWQYGYSKEYVKTHRQAKKYGIVDELIGKEDDVRRRALADMSSKDDRTRIMAAIIELLWDTAGRIGTGGKDTYGITTLNKKHIKPKGKGYVIRYVGKGEGPQVHNLQPNTGGVGYKKMVGIISELIERAEPGERVFRDLSGKLVDAKSVNIYLKKISGIEKATAHKIRTAIGTKMARELIKTAPIMKKAGKVSQSEAAKEFKELMEDVGKKLGHTRTAGGQTKITSATAIKSYIDPSVTVEFFDKLGVPVPDTYVRMFHLEQQVKE